MFPKVYDQSMGFQAILENASKIGFTKKYNELWNASFSLPADDPKVAECLPLRFVEIFDGDEQVGMFRIIPTQTSRSGEEKTITYQLEHVLATLLDDVLFQYHQIGGAGVFTDDVLTYILSKQAVTRWQLGTVAFTQQFMYNFENENLLAAIFSVPKPFLGEYQWTWNTSTYPWTLNLIEPSTEVSAYIRYRKNLINIGKNEDPTNLCTRLYPLGYGEGINQLGIAGVNPTTQAYIDASTQATYGVVSRVWVDRSIENATNLFNTGKAMLEQMKLPAISYSVDAADLYQITEDPIDKFEKGAMVNCIDSELGFNFNARVVSVSKSDVTGNPGDVKIEIANKVKDIASSITDLAVRTSINELYSQGATNLDSHDFADNCDPENPAVIKFYIPAETVRINKMLLSYETGAFRAYSKAIQEGGAVIETDSDVQILVPGYSEDFTASGGDPSHDHQLFNHAHQITLPPHTHGIEYGIYEGPTPTSLTVQVDGNAVAGLGISETDVDIIPYLAKDAEGKIIRGSWHEITITPDSLGRIVANVVMQLFVQSRGGGNY